MPDIPRFSTALAEWCACMMYCLILPGGIRGKKMAAWSALFLFVLTAFLVMTDDVSRILWLPCMLAAFASMFVFIRFIGRQNLINAVYYTMRAIILAEFAASLEWQLHYFFIGTPALTPVLFGTSILHMLIVYAAVFAAAAFVEKSIGGEGAAQSYGTQDALAAALVAAGTFAFSNLSFLMQNTPFSASVAREIFMVRTLADLGGLMILYAFQSRTGKLQAEKELGNIQTVMASQYENYRNYQESIDLINFKYHDLKHQLAGLRSTADPKRRSDALEAMEKELEEYRPEQQTGSPVLDAILAGKTAQCRKSGISLTCVADGSLLSFMHVSDVCSIFGNALDNAIEYTSLLDDPRKRMVHMKVAKKKNFLFIEISNYCEHAIPLRDGMPYSTGKDGKIHGYGVKSMQYAVRKYGGTIQYAHEGKHLFVLRILIPMQPK